MAVSKFISISFPWNSSRDCASSLVDLVQRDHGNTCTALFHVRGGVVDVTFIRNHLAPHNVVDLGPFPPVLF